MIAGSYATAQRLAGTLVNPWWPDRVRLSFKAFAVEGMFTLPADSISFGLLYIRFSRYYGPFIVSN
jgi:hypothetical protein